LVKMANEHPAQIVVITGGEPLMYDLSQLTQQLKAADKNTHIETSGVYPLTGHWDWICFSPKKFKKPREVFYERSDELKLVIYHKSDFKWAIEHSKKMNPKAKWLLQPEWSRQEEILPLIIAFVKEHPRWSISLQTHKFMDIP
jgi:7-carboxy-7-deazaguanine synthase